MGDKTLGSLVFRLKIGDDQTWHHIKSIHNDMLNIVIVKDLLDKDLPLGLRLVVLEETWERASHRIGEFVVEEGMTGRDLFIWLRDISRSFQDQLATIYHDIDSRQFIALLVEPRHDEQREDYNWAWKHLSQHHERTLMATIHAVLASRMAFTPGDVEDIWQRAYLNIQRRIGEFKPQFKGALLRWMHSHVRNEALNFHRVHLAKQHDSIDKYEYQIGVDFEDPFDGDNSRKKEMRQAYYDALIEIILELPNKSASQTLSLDQQRRAIKRLFDEFEKPGDVASSFSVEPHVMHNLMRVVKRRLEKCEHLAQYVRPKTSDTNTRVLKQSSNL